jgi:hypothetical protein
MLDEVEMFGDQKRSSGGYTIWKEIIGTLIGVAPFALLFFLWMATVQTRLAVLEEARATQSYRDNSQDATYNAGIARIELSQQRMEATIVDINKFLLNNRVRNRDER